MEYKREDFTIEKLEEVFKELFYNRKSPKKGEQIKGWRGCSTRGMVSLDAEHCGDVDCSSCNTVKQAFMDALNDWENDNKG